jgi:uncharacterized surface protein with fasciclin (FAS1) repeats
MALGCPSLKENVMKQFDGTHGNHQSAHTSRSIQTMLKNTFAVAAVAAVVLTVAASGTTAVRAETRDVVDTAIAAGSFKTLAKALGAAGLVTTLKGAGPFTVFAPTDAAFAKLPAGTLETLLKPENKEKLRRILTYHVVAGKVMASDVVKLQSAKAVSGDTITVKVENGAVHVDSATVTSADVVASNGVIHVIDSVILPKGL